MDEIEIARKFADEKGYKGFKYLAYGGNATVCAAIDESRKIAIKVTPYTSNLATFCGSVVERLPDHPSLVKIHSVERRTEEDGDRRGDYYIITMDYVDHTSMQSFFHNHLPNPSYSLSPDEPIDRSAADYRDFVCRNRHKTVEGETNLTYGEVIDGVSARSLIYVGQALQALHKANVTHTDVSPRNIFLRSTNLWPVLGDTDSTVKLYNGKAIFLPTGTVPFISPEVLTAVQIGEKSAVYSLGMIMMGALRGLPGFLQVQSFTNQIGELRELITTSGIEGRLQDYIREDESTLPFQDAMIEALRQNPDLRPDLDTFVAQLDEIRKKHIGAAKEDDIVRVALRMI
jgi:serine/threonine protein kinase